MTSPRTEPIPDPTDRAVQLMRELDAQKTDGPVRAHWIGRTIARLIDFAIVFPSTLVIIAAADTIALGFGAELRDDDLRTTPTGTLVSWVTLGAILAFCTAYEAGLTWWRGGTPGKRRMQLRVVRMDGTRIGLGQSLCRYAVWAVPFLVCFIGWGMTFPQQPTLSLLFFTGAFASLGIMAWGGRDPDGRGLHDRVAGTKVLTHE